MKLLLNFVLLALYFTSIRGWTASELTDDTVDHPGHCYSTKEGVGAMEKWETKTQPGECVRLDCQEGGIIQYSGCGTIAGLPDHCKNEIDLSKPYPECCPNIANCPEIDATATEAT